MDIIGILMLVIGIGLAIIGNLWLLVNTFRVSILCSPALRSSSASPTTQG